MCHTIRNEAGFSPRLDNLLSTRFPIEIFLKQKQKLANLDNSIVGATKVTSYIEGVVSF